VLAEILELGRADEREVRRIEEEHRPLAGEVRLGDVEEVLALLERGRLERLDGAADDSHGILHLVVEANDFRRA
jgi:hypothetical protein